MEGGGDYLIGGLIGVDPLVVRLMDFIFELGILLGSSGWLS